MDKQDLTTFDKFMKDETQKQLFISEYNEFLVSEFLLEAMLENNISVKKLSEKSGVATSIIQNLKAEKETDITLKNMLLLASSLGYRISFEKINYVRK